MSGNAVKHGSGWPLYGGDIPKKNKSANYKPRKYKPWECPKNSHQNVRIQNFEKK